MPTTTGRADAARSGINFGLYRQLVFDCDGVIVDSNAVKQANIREAALAVCDAETAERFVEYFVGNNGVTRETKINAFFSDPEVRSAVLAAYNRLNATTVPLIEPPAETRAFLETLHAEGVPLYLLSGGDEREVRELLQNAGIAALFRAILAGPVSKVEHLQRLKLAGPTCYFGDSRYDYEVASRFGFDFVFVSRYTQFADWASFFLHRPGVVIVEDFRSLHPE